MSSSSSGIFCAYSRYYNLLYRDKDYAGEVEYVDQLLDDSGVPGRQILEFGSGTGKHGRLLAERGYQVHGIEQSAEMVARATATEGFTCQVGDICTIQLGRTYDAVLSLFHVISYQISNTSVQAVFARAAEHLKPAGLFLFDVWYSPAVYAQGPEARVKRLADDSVEIVRVAEPVAYPNENRVDVNYLIFARDLTVGKYEILEETHPMRHFSIPELVMLAQTAGFELVTVEEFLTGRDPSDSTWGVCVVLRRT